jgi:lipoprotein-anchoring transpeptidase ErfK/SrfK
MPFNNGIGLHDAQWRKSFGGSIYVGTGSHGCINLPLSTASIIYQNLSPGTIVLCY